ncbi:aspartate/glutamate racemase family protein [Sphaerisporangium sp. NBC_01403]|uniref:aspartate/glutamate racemase family protein n=1 Tax=Sphaerisporangium sp. NBC_01403 TaxID=2903599 RepID=UPI00324DAE9D
MTDTQLATVTGLNARLGPTIAFVHTVTALAPVFEDLAQSGIAGVNTRHILDEALLGAATAEPGLAFDRAVTALQRHVDSAVAGGADVIVVTCSTLGPATDVISATREVPVIRIDRPMARQAIRYRRVGVIATLESNRAASRAIIEQTAAQEGRSVRVIDRLCDGAFEHLQAGRSDRHDEAVRRAVADISAEVDVVVLAQATMAGALDGADVPVPVLTSPAAAVAEAALHARRSTVSGTRPCHRGGVAQLRIYRIRQGLMADWLPFFHKTLVPLHHVVGIRVPAAWVNVEDPDEFVWIREFDSVESIPQQENEFFSTAARSALGDVRERYVESLQVRVLDSREPLAQDGSARTSDSNT